ncbi:DUF1285 domain-containing protein [Colwellia sp. BRX10-6]|uniref:DUF1285 domain-containing protein n=1 Tax=unclassified Colwellia TaxID=196834 RepID=UPI0015F58B49|nr:MULTISPECIES: DUF1285 domain-containing protein [unclassified Colwellia]MBA6381757.1 DUF1285 domain-containing protein [Colwellia sp. BRX10-9]MBA6393562.1 DUF1285 domain-containing protein [Colwellia sp. BRX10-6]
MSLDKISEQLNKLTPGNTKKLPPIESWNPPYCGEIDLQVKGNGDWFYGGTIFKRLSLVKLFASVLLREVAGDRDEYFLVTPAEKVKIIVEDAPFVLTQWAWQDDNKSIMTVSTNVDDEFVLDETHPLTMNANGELYVLVRRNLLAKVHRNVYYQWADLAQEEVTEKGVELIFSSAGHKFSLGKID